jgi:hypothetical protein
MALSETRKRKIIKDQLVALWLTHLDHPDPNWDLVEKHFQKHLSDEDWASAEKEAQTKKEEWDVVETVRVPLMKDYHARESASSATSTEEVRHEMR